ncbi:MAG TPA: PLP-dependent aminotransferase family protein [Myxococcaceae bacterium]|nr:PLP-dependent aminotransferase family protein [Myxococcaceae bacterium]
MPRRSGTLELVLQPRAPGQPAQRWVYEALRSAILAGRLHGGARLPATRDLARQHRLARGTVVAAFAQLRAEGYVRSTVGSGTFVGEVPPDALLGLGGPAGRTAQPPRPGRVQLSRFARRVRSFPVLEGRRTRAFRTDLPALELFPATLWAQVTGRVLRRASTRLLLGCEPLGYRPLRAAVAAHLRATRGARCEADQLAIVSGVQEALDLAARMLVDPGDRVCLEDPGYGGAARAFSAVGARLVPVPVDAEGLVLDRRRLDGARLVYTTPAHQYPLGVTMSVARRLALLRWARTSRAVLFEDDYDGEYRYHGRPIPSLQGLDPDAPVLLAGSFGKVLFPALRLGYLVLPGPLVERVAALRSATVRHPPVLEQAVLARFIDDGHLGRHVRRMREVYAERRGVLYEAAGRALGDVLALSPVEAGLQTSGLLAPGLRADGIVRAAAEQEVEVTALGREWRGGFRREGLLLGFAAVPPGEIRRGVEVLASVLEEGRTAMRR